MLLEPLACQRGDDGRNLATRALAGGLSGAEQEALLRRLNAGRRAGQIRADADLKSAADALTGAVVVTVLARAPLTTERVRTLLDVVLNGIAPKPSGLGAAGSDRSVDAS
ncbi:hypothetical protein [Actinomadura sp. 9N407]|uniref:hypothetical protein n=1 Tax=Actinomadura sp. 9N407 TaxID=3375154 RepID=UPI0037AECC5C